jgi:hypothetical protein
LAAALERCIRIPSLAAVSGAPGTKRTHQLLARKPQVQALGCFLPEHVIDTPRSGQLFQLHAKQVSMERMLLLRHGM